MRIIGIDTERQRVSLSMLQYSEEAEAAAQATGATFGGGGDSPTPRRDPAARNGQQQRASSTSSGDQPRRPRRDRDDMGPSFPSTGSFAVRRRARRARPAGSHAHTAPPPPRARCPLAAQGDRAVMDEDEDAPTLFEHAWLSAQQTAAAKGISLPSDMAE